METIPYEVETYHKNEIDAVDASFTISLELTPCPICTRTFVPATLAKHVKICEKMAVKKRKTFDSSRQRREGTDLADFLPKNYGLPSSKVEPKQPPKILQHQPCTIPKRQNEIITKTSSYSPQVAAVQKKPLNPIKPTAIATPSREKPKILAKRSLVVVPPAEQCPFCERCFGNKAYDRHVEWCKEKTLISRNKKVKTTNLAKERLQARNQYRPPCLKTKRAANREKYSGFGCGDSSNSLNEFMGESQHTNEGEQKMSMSTSLSSSMMSDSNNEPQETCKTLEDADLLSNEEIEFEEIKRPIHNDIKSISGITEIYAIKTSDDDSESVSSLKQSKLSTEITSLSSILKNFDANHESIDSITPCNLVDSDLNFPFEKEFSRKNFTYLSENDDERTLKEPLMKISKNATTEFPNEENLSEEENIVGHRSDDDDDFKVSVEEYTNTDFQEPKDINSKLTLKKQKLPTEINTKLSSTNNKEIITLLLPKQQENVSSKVNNKMLKEKKFNCEETVVEEYEEDFEISIKNSKEQLENHQIYSIESILALNLYDFPEVINDDISYEEVINTAKSYVIKSGLSDKYDPFMSAKRQLEELCSPTSPPPPPPPTTETTIVLPKTPITQKPLQTNLSTSYSGNTKSYLNNTKASFRRTSSLRAPRKTTPTRPLFLTQQHRPTIQRGISDEGPISSSFLKPEEYDEMPVKSVCVNDFAIHNSPKVIKRDIHSNPNRRHLKLNLNKSNNNNTPLSKTDSLAVFLKYENETKNLDSVKLLTEKDLKDKSNNLSKQTSLKNSSNDLNNMLCSGIGIAEQQNNNDPEKLTTLKTSLTNLTNNDINISATPTKQGYPIKLEPITKTIQSTPMKSTTPILPPIGTIRLTNILLDTKDNNDYIDPKLINICDNLPINVTKLSDSDITTTTSSSTDSVLTTKYLSETQLDRQKQFQDTQQTLSNRNSTEKRNLLKRQIRLGKNQFLYDMSPVDSDQSEPSPIISETNHKFNITNTNSNNNNNNNNNNNFDNEPKFDDFDFEEFLASFADDDNEQYPIFKDYKEFLSTRSFNKRSNNFIENSIRSPNLSNCDNDDVQEFGEFHDDNNDDEEQQQNSNDLHNEEDQKQDRQQKYNKTMSKSINIPPILNQNTDRNINEIPEEEVEIAISIECDQPEDGNLENRDSFENIDINQNNLNENVSPTTDENDFGNENIDRMMCESTTSMYPIDSDEISSIEGFPFRSHTKSKQSADSAYGSLSRQSPIDQSINRRNPKRNHQQFITTPPLSAELHLSKSKHLQKTDTKRRSRDLSASSSGSDNSLPPIQLQKDKSSENLPYDEKSKELRMSKFCHECGSKFLILQAKFCMECGVKRMILE